MNPSRPSGATSRDASARGPALLLLLAAACGPGSPLPPALDAGSDAGVREPMPADGGASGVALLALAPTLGPAGTPVELLGRGFGPGLEVRFGQAPALEVEVLSAERARCRAPVGSGTVDVSAGGATLQAAFRYAPGPSRPDAGTTPDAGARAPSRTLEAEAFTASFGVQVVGTAVGFLDDGDWLAWSGVDFGAGGANTLVVTLSAPASTAGQRLELRLDAFDGPLLGTLTVATTGAWDVYAGQTVQLGGATGQHTLFAVGRGTRDVANLDRLQLNP